MIAGLNREDALILEFTQFAPPQRVDDVVLNKRGTTFRKLSEADKAAADDREAAVALLADNPSMIKRPIVEYAGGILVGFKEAEWAAALG